MDFKKGNSNEICSAEIDAIEQWMTNMTTLEEYTTFDCSNIKKLIDNIISKRVICSNSKHKIRETGRRRGVEILKNDFIYGWL